MRLFTKIIAGLIRKGEVNNRVSFVGNFISYLCNWTELRRNTYVGNDTSKTYGSIENRSIQDALRDLMTIVHDCSPSQITVFSNRLKSLSATAKVASIAKMYYNVFVVDKWYNLSASNKNAYINKIINWLEAIKCFDALELTPEMRSKLVDVDMRVLVDFFMTFLTNDYTTNMYGTDGFTQILTLLRNVEAIGQNHSPNVAMAWLRAQDSLYANETGKVSASYVMPASEVGYSAKASAMKVSATGEQILSDVVAPENINSEYVEDPLPLLNTRTSATATYVSGAVEEVPVTWDTTNFESYYLNRIIADNPELWISYSYGNEEPGDLAAPQLFIFKGKVNLPGNVTNPYNVSTDLILEAFVDGLPEKEVPYAFPPDGEYYGSLKVTLGCLNDKSADIYYALTLKGIWGEDEKYTGPITLELEEGATESKDFYLIACNKSNEPDYADSDIMVWHYTIYPVDPDNAVAEDRTFRYTLAKTFTLSKDEAVCWRINSADVDDSIMYAVNTDSADTAPVKECVVTVCTLAETTPAGTYSIPVQISKDGGKTWTEDSAITFRTSDLVSSEKEQNKPDSPQNQSVSPGSSSGGCTTGLTLCGAGLAGLALMLRRKSR